MTNLKLTKFNRNLDILWQCDFLRVPQVIVAKKYGLTQGHLSELLAKLRKDNIMLASLEMRRRRIEREERLSFT